MGDIVVAGQQPGDEAVNGIVAGNGVFIGIDQTRLTADLIGQTDVLFYHDDVAFAFLDGAIGHFHHGLGLAGAFVSYD